MEKKTAFLSYKFKEWARDITSLASPLLLLLIPFVILGNTRIFYTLLIALLLNEIVASLIKIVFPKKRPDGQTYNSMLEKIDAGSFPSIHASRITIVYLTLFSQTESVALQILFIVIIVLVFLSRILLKKHFWVDVFGGFVLGVLIWLGLSYL